MAFLRRHPLGPKMFRLGLTLAVTYHGMKRERGPKKKKKSPTGLAERRRYGTHRFSWETGRKKTTLTLTRPWDASHRPSRDSDAGARTSRVPRAMRPISSRALFISKTVKSALTSEPRRDASYLAPRRQRDKWTARNYFSHRSLL